MTSKQIQRGFYFFLLWGLVGCQTPKTADEILSRSIQAHGFDHNIDQLSYLKTTQLFYPDGTLEKRIQQTHHIKWQPFEYRIDEGEKKLFRKGNTIQKFMDGIKVEDSLEILSARNTLNAAYFVFWQPAKLVDKKAVLTYTGKKKLQNKTLVDVVAVAYLESTSTDRWEFYFDPKSYLNLGYSVQHNGRWSLILNDDFHREHRPILVKNRRSLFVDSLTQTTVLRAAYTYELLP